MTNREREKLIREAVKKAKEKGWEIDPDVYSESRRCCAVGALVMAHRGRTAANVLAFPWATAAEILETDRLWVESLEDGFRDLTIEQWAWAKGAYRLGQKLRKEFVEGAE